MTSPHPHPKPQPQPLSEISISSLLYRFSEAAFFVHHDEYLKNDITTPQQILHPALTASEIQSIETKIGSPLPQDVKEIASVADGFHGGWHFAGGGWPGIKNLYRTEARDYALYFGYEPAPEKRIERRTRKNGSEYEVTINVTSFGRKDDEILNEWGNGEGVVFVGIPERECDDFEHVICPENIWRGLQERNRGEWREGDYGFLYFAHWMDGGEVNTSVRKWIEELTEELERDAEEGKREECPD